MPATKRPLSPTADDQPAAKVQRVESLDEDEVKDGGGVAPTTGEFLDVYEPKEACNVILQQGDWRIHVHHVDLIRRGGGFFRAIKLEADGIIPLPPGTFHSANEFVSFMRTLLCGDTSHATNYPSGDERTTLAILRGEYLFNFFEAKGFHNHAIRELSKRPCGTSGSESSVSPDGVTLSPAAAFDLGLRRAHSPLMANAARAYAMDRIIPPIHMHEHLIPHWFERINTDTAAVEKVRTRITEYRMSYIGRQGCQCNPNRSDCFRRVCPTRSGLVDHTREGENTNDYSQLEVPMINAIASLVGLPTTTKHSPATGVDESD